MKLIEDNTRIYLFRGKHPIYEALVRSPPDGVDYVPESESFETQEYALYNPASSQARAVVDGVFRFLDYPRIIPVVRRYDLVHSCRGFIVVGRNRYVVDFEHVSSFVGMHHSRLKSERLRRRLDRMLCSDKCERLLPHSRAAMESLCVLSSGKKLKQKSTVIYPTVLAPQEIPIRTVEKNPPRILFYGEYYWKGGREVLRACKRLSKKMEFTLTYISCRIHPPRDVVKDARESINLEYYEGAIPRARLLGEVYPNTDIFVMPTYLDTLGFGYMEAMAYGLPCIGTSVFAVPEIVENGVTGILVDPPVRFYDGTGMGHPEIDVSQANTDSTVEDIAVAIERLVSSSSLRQSMGAAARMTMTEGRLSVRARNCILKQVYEESTRH